MSKAIQLHRDGRQGRSLRSRARKATSRPLRKWRAVAAAVAAFGLNVAHCEATDFYGGSEWFAGGWTDALGTSLSGVPLMPADNAFIWGSRATYNQNALWGEANIGTLVVDDFGVGQLEISRGVLSASSATIGGDYIGVVSLVARGQESISFNITNDLSVGKNVGSYGAIGLGYGFSTTQQRLSVGGSLFVGEGGQGTFEQQGGETVVGGDFIVRSGTGTSVSWATMQGGTLTVGGNEFIGTDSGNGSESFTQSGGTHTIDGDLRARGWLR